MADQLASQISAQMDAELAPIHRLSRTEILYELDHIKDDRRADFVCALVITSVLAYTSVALRLFSRRLIKARLQADDAWIIVSLVILTAQLGIGLGGVQLSGAGRHAILIKNPGTYAQIAIAAEILYVAGTATVKISILMLYRRLFAAKRKFEIVLWALGAFVLAYSVIEVIVVIFQSNPVQAAWVVSIQPSYCINLPLAALIFGIINVITDMVTLVLPVHIVWGLQLSRRVKFQIVGIFLLGGFVCVGSIYRCTVVHELGNKDVTWGLIDPGIWAFVENSIGIVSACLPVLRPVYNVVVHRHHCVDRKTCARCQRSKNLESSGNVFAMSLYEESRTKIPEEGRMEETRHPSGPMDRRQSVPRTREHQYGEKIWPSIEIL